MSCCSIGARPDVADIDAALRTGGHQGGVRRLAARFSTRAAPISREELRLHRQHVLGGTSSGSGSANVAALDQAVGAVFEATADHQSRARMKLLEKTLTSPPSEAPPDSDSDVQEFPPLPPDRMSRVMVIEDLMLDLHWQKGKTGPRLAAAWGLNLPVIESYSAEASRNIRRNVDPAAVKDRLATSLRRGLDQALDSGELKALAGIAKAHGEVVGLLSGAKVQVQIDFDSASRGMAAFLLAVAPEAGPLFAEWLADLRRGDPVAKADPAAWVSGRRPTITLEEKSGAT